LDNNTIQTGQANIANLNTASQQTHLHIDLIKTFYSITPYELQILEDGSSSVWKDVTLTGFGIGIPCFINFLIEFQKNIVLNSVIFWNGIVGSVCIIIAIIFAWLWSNSKNPCRNLIKEIKDRPKYNV
jgi:hypothetical protein